MDFVVGGYPDIKNKLSEVALLKVAALYGDKITLISPMYQLYDAITVNVNAKNNELAIVNSIIKLLPLCEMADSSFAEQSTPIYDFKNIVASKSYRNAPIKYKLETRKQLKQTYDEIIEKLNEILGADEINDINRLKRENRLIVQKFNNSSLVDDNFINEYIFSVSNSMKQAYPLLDHRLGDLITNYRNVIQDDISQIERKNIITSGLARKLMIELPAFDSASMDEIIDLRRELDRYLVRFRAAILTYSEEITVLPWDSEFDLNCEQVFIKHVEPAILELKEQVDDNRIYKNLFGSLLSDDKLKSLIGSVIISSATYISTNGTDTTINPELLAAGAFGLSELSKAGYKTSEKNKQIKRNNLYFYYKASDKYK